jgi:hypothetical protein
MRAAIANSEDLGALIAVSQTVTVEPSSGGSVPVTEVEPEKKVVPQHPIADVMHGGQAAEAVTEDEE